jgi:hypothetical protein
MAFFLQHRILIGSDFNVKYQCWGSRLTNTHGKELYNTIQENKLEILSTGEPAYWLININRTANLLDFFVFKGLSHNYLGMKPNLEVAFDCMPVIATIDTVIMSCTLLHIWK